MMERALPFGKTEIRFGLPDRLAVQWMRPRHADPIPGLPEALHRALDRPVGTPPLDRLISKTARIIILCDDDTRPTPIRRLLPPLLERLRSAGIPDAQIRFLMAYGLHRPMNASQLEHRLGREVVDRFAVMHHDAYQGGGLSLKGTTSSGIPVFLNSSLDDADVTIGIGNISLSKEAGYGGGAKILMPGVAGEETIYRSHAKVREHPNQIGRLQGNPIRQDIEESGRLGKLSFIINTVLNEQDAVCRLVSGHPEIAFKLGVGEFNQIYEVPVHGAFDLLVVSSSPMDTDFYQANKAISASSLGVRDGGTIVMVSPCLNGVSSFPYFDEMITSGRTYGEWQETIAEPDFRHKVAAEICLSLRYLQDVRKIRIGMVTPGIPHETVAKMGILPYVSVEAAVRDAQDRYGNGLRLGFVPKAPLTLLSPLGF